MNDGLGRVCSKYGATTSLVNVTLDGEEYISSQLKKPEKISGFIFIQKTSHFQILYLDFQYSMPIY